MTYGYIYKIVFPNKKHYIGLTTSIKQRTTQHKQNTKTGDTKCVYNALRKYEMVDTLELIEIDTADTNEELCQKEIEYIIKYNSYYMNGNGYNMTYGGEGTKGYVFTEEDNKKNSERLKKYHKNNPEVRREYYKNNPEKGKEHGERLKLLYKNNPEKKQLMSELKNKQYENNPEIIQLMSELKIKYYKNNPEARQRASEITTKQFENPEARQKASEIKKIYHKNNPEKGKEHGERLKLLYKNNPELGKIRSEKMRLKSSGKVFNGFNAIGELVGEWNYIPDCKKELFPDKQNCDICGVLAGRKQTCYGYTFLYK